MKGLLKEVDLQNLKLNDTVCHRRNLDKIILRITKPKIVLEAFDSKVDMDMKTVDTGLLGLQLYYIDGSGRWETGQPYFINTLLEAPINEEQLTVLSNFINDVLVPHLSEAYEKGKLLDTFKKLEFFSEDWFTRIPGYILEEGWISLF